MRAPTISWYQFVFHFCTAAGRKSWTWIGTKKRPLLQDLWAGNSFCASYSGVARGRIQGTPKFCPTGIRLQGAPRRVFPKGFFLRAGQRFWPTRSQGTQELLFYPGLFLRAPMSFVHGRFFCSAGQSFVQHDESGQARVFVPVTLAWPERIHGRP